MAQLSFSESLQMALQKEIEQHVHQATVVLREQLQRIRKREQEALQDLTDIEKKAGLLSDELAEVKQVADQHAQQTERAIAEAAHAQEESERARKGASKYEAQTKKLSNELVKALKSAASLK